jgi:hypothetical protein
MAMKSRKKQIWKVDVFFLHLFRYDVPQFLVLSSDGTVKFL